MPKLQSKDPIKPNLNSSVFCFAPEPETQAEDTSNKYCFRVQPLDVAPPTEDKKQRTFSGVAYSGEPITDHWYWDRVIFDLASMQIKGCIPALLDHRSSQRAGAVNEYQVDPAKGLNVSGVLMSNEFGAQVARDSDDGFPWQMSVRIEPSSVEEIKADQSVVVNGKTYQGPITVFRGGRIREVSFCALGADDNTNAVAASHNPNPKSKEDTNMDLEQALARITELESTTTAKDQVISDLQAEVSAFSAAKREADIASLASDIGREFSAEDAAEMAALDDKAFAFAAKHLRAQQQMFSSKQAEKPKLPAHLFSDTATNGQDPSAKTLSIAEQAKNY